MEVIQQWRSQDFKNGQGRVWGGGDWTGEANIFYVLMNITTVNYNILVD